MGLRRTFSLRETATLHLTFQIEADVDPATNSTFFNLGSAGAWDTTGDGEMSGQNQQIPPRDWQFAGCFRFSTSNHQKESAGRSYAGRIFLGGGMIIQCARLRTIAVVFARDLAFYICRPVARTSRPPAMPNGTRQDFRPPVDESKENTKFEVVSGCKQTSMLGEALKT